MLAHIIYKNIDNKVATFSKVITNELLRNLLSFKGLILSDDLSMKALSGDIISKVKKTYDAGCDVILYCHGILDEMQKMYPFSRKIDINNLLMQGNTNTKAIGLYLYTDYFIIFQMSGFVLLVAMIGAIVLAYEKNENYIKQDVFYQQNIDKKKLIKLNDVNPDS